MRRNGKRAHRNVKQYFDGALLSMMTKTMKQQTQKRHLFSREHLGYDNKQVKKHSVYAILVFLSSFATLRVRKHEDASLPIKFAIHLHHPFFAHLDVSGNRHHYFHLRATTSGPHGPHTCAILRMKYYIVSQYLQPA